MTEKPGFSLQGMRSSLPACQRAKALQNAHKQVIGGRITGILTYWVPFLLIGNWL